jgi:hypothetical protein
MMALQKSQDTAAINNPYERTEFKKPNRGRIRETTPVDKSQMNTILWICLVEKNCVMEGSPAFS